MAGKIGCFVFFLYPVSLYDKGSADIVEVRCPRNDDGRNRKARNVVTIKFRVEVIVPAVITRSLVFFRVHAGQSAQETGLSRQPMAPTGTGERILVPLVDDRTHPVDAEKILLLSDVMLP